VKAQRFASAARRSWEMVKETLWLGAFLPAEVRSDQPTEALTASALKEKTKHPAKATTGQTSEEMTGYPLEKASPVAHPSTGNPPPN
jgi:hypothetical protein